MRWVYAGITSKSSNRKESNYESHGGKTWHFRKLLLRNWKRWTAKENGYAPCFWAGHHFGSAGFQDCSTRHEPMRGWEDGYLGTNRWYGYRVWEVSRKRRALKKVALALYETCKGAKLSVGEVKTVCQKLEEMANQSHLSWNSFFHKAVKELEMERGEEMKFDVFATLAIIFSVISLLRRG